tara:strand:- start:13030 stop:13428 length:399 start_codon:yes stop_codon:yes gene_type:complete
MEIPKKVSGKYFSAEELECKCGGAPLSCSTPDFCDLLLSDLDELREEWRAPLWITSGKRCKNHNKRVNGHRRSAHLLGKAVDIKMFPKDYIKFIALIHRKSKHITGVGLGLKRGFIHLDTAHPERGARCWVY